MDTVLHYRILCVYNRCRAIDEIDGMWMSSSDMFNHYIKIKNDLLL
jgi:hypothetical protein